MQGGWCNDIWANHTIGPCEQPQSHVLLIAYQHFVARWGYCSGVGLAWFSASEARWLCSMNWASSTLYRESWVVQTLVYRPIMKCKDDSDLQPLWADTAPCMHMQLLWYCDMISLCDVIQIIGFFPLFQFPHNLSTLTKWELTEWEVDKVGILFSI